MKKLIFPIIILLILIIVTDVAASTVSEEASEPVKALPDNRLTNIISEMIVENWSGVCLTTLYGKAKITSGVDVAGQNSEVANGTADYTGLSLSFENSQKVKGFSWLLHPRFLSQTISIADFREEIRYAHVAGTQNIDYIVTDFDTGDPVDPLDVNRYEIDINSMGLVLNGMYQLNSEDKFQLVQTYVNLYCGIGLAEFFDIGIRLGEDDPSNRKWYFASSYSAGVSGGVLIKAIDTLFEIKYQYTIYPKLTLPENAEFRYRYVYNEEKDVYERARLFVDEVDFSKSAVCLSVTYFFN